MVWAVRHFRPYLYGHRCTVYTDHEALKSLLNTPHPSGKLAQWGMALQELNLHITYRPGKKNEKADALSRSPLRDEKPATTMPFTLVAPIPKPDVPVNDGDTLSQRQEADPELQPIIAYQESGVLPEDKHRARELVLNQSQFTLLDGKELFHAVHGGTFGGHLRDAKVHGQLSRHYWWQE